MAYSNVPVNGWPQIKDLEKLDSIAQQIQNMPTFTSDDKAFLADLPAYPDTDGVKVLTATTSSGETILSYEEPESGGGVNYSTEEQATGQKWTDGKDIYFKTIFFQNTSITKETWTQLNIDMTVYDYWRIENQFMDNRQYPLLFMKHNGVLEVYSSFDISLERFTLYYTKATT